MAPALTFYEDLEARVRKDGRWHSIKSLVQPNDPWVRAIAGEFAKCPYPIRAAQDFISNYTMYRREKGDYWATPIETLKRRAGDCDDLAILLCSILRNFIPEDEIYCGIGTWDGEGHMYGYMVGDYGDDIILEATRPPWKPMVGKYTLSALFNDKEAYATPRGISEYGLIPLEYLAQLEGLKIATFLRMKP